MAGDPEIISEWRVMRAKQAGPGYSNQRDDDFSLVWIASGLPTNWTESGWAVSARQNSMGLSCCQSARCRLSSAFPLC